MKHLVRSAALAGCTLSLAAAPAAAAPTTVELQIEGQSATHFDGPVTTDVRTVDGNDGTGPHTCDGTNNGQGGSPAPTAGTALADGAAGPGGFTYKANYFSSLDDLSLDTVNGETPDFNADGTFWGFYVNGSFASVGMCQTRVQPGDRILFARANGSETILAMSGPATASTGQAATYTVTDAGNGSPVVGADVGGQSTGPDGKATLTFDTPGTRSLKATRAGAVRSNAVRTCVHAGDDGSCGTAGPTAVTGGGVVPRGPGSLVLGLRSAQRFPAGRGPRLLRGRVQLGTEPLAAVRLRLRRVLRGRCHFWSLTFERWRRRPCRIGGFYYTIGDRTEWSYLFPARLGPGRYDMHALAIDRAGRRHDAYVLFYVGGRP